MTFFSVLPTVKDSDRYAKALLWGKNDPLLAPVFVSIASVRCFPQSAEK